MVGSFLGLFLSCRACRAFQALSWHLPVPVQPGLLCLPPSQNTPCTLDSAMTWKADFLPFLQLGAMSGVFIDEGEQHLGEETGRRAVGKPQVLLSHLLHLLCAPLQGRVALLSQVRAIP